MKLVQGGARRAPRVTWEKSKTKKREIQQLSKQIREGFPLVPITESMPYHYVDTLANAFENH
ncbi:MAG: hypothetical protein WCF17_17940 [Terracidiphilus sp.]